MTASKPTLTDVLRKRRQGMKLTDAEETVFRGYHKEAQERSTKIYWESREQRKEFQDLAEEAGAKNFSAWFIEKAKRGLDATVYTKQDFERALQDKDEAVKLHKSAVASADYLRDQAEKFEAERDRARERVEELERAVEQFEKRLKTLVGGRK